MILWKLEIIISFWLKYFSIAMTSSFVAKAHKAVWSQRPFEPSVPSKFAQLSEIKCKKRTLDYNCFLQSQKQSLWFWSILIIWASGRNWVQTTWDWRHLRVWLQLQGPLCLHRPLWHQVKRPWYQVWASARLVLCFKKSLPQGIKNGSLTAIRRVGSTANNHQRDKGKEFDGKEEVKVEEKEVESINCSLHPNLSRSLHMSNVLPHWSTIIMWSRHNSVLAALGQFSNHALSTLFSQIGEGKIFEYFWSLSYCQSQMVEYFLLKLQNLFLTSENCACLNKERA